MKIAYVAHWNVSHENGVVKKMATQLRMWQHLGHTVRLFVLAEETALWHGLRELPVTVVQRGTLAQRYARAAELVRQTLDWQPERLLKRVPTVAEFNGNNLIAARQLPWYRHFYYLVTHTRILQRLRGMVVVSSELVGGLQRYGKPVLVLGNSIDLDDYQPLPPVNNPHPRLVFMGWNVTFANLHGVDKMCWLAERYPTWHLDLIGLKERSAAALNAPNITTYPLLTRSEYEPLLAQADVALGPLALYRRGLGETSAIKIGEYLAFGIPTITGYRETNFPPSVPYLLQIPSAVDNVERYVHQIEQFVRSWHGKRVARADVQPMIDARVLEQKRLAFMSQVA
jgi:hypothetical protein